MFAVYIAFHILTSFRSALSTVLAIIKQSHFAIASHSFVSALFSSYWG